MPRNFLRKCQQQLGHQNWYPFWKCLMIKKIFWVVIKITSFRHASNAAHIHRDSMKATFINDAKFRSVPMSVPWSWSVWLPYQSIFNMQSKIKNNNVLICTNSSLDPYLHTLFRLQKLDFEPCPTCQIYWYGSCVQWLDMYVQNHLHTCRKQRISPLYNSKRFWEEIHHFPSLQTWVKNLLCCQVSFSKILWEGPPSNITNNDFLKFGLMWSVRLCLFILAYFLHLKIVTVHNLSLFYQLVDEGYWPLVQINHSLLGMQNMWTAAYFYRSCNSLQSHCCFYFFLSADFVWTVPSLHRYAFYSAKVFFCFKLRTVERHTFTHW